MYIQLLPVPFLSSFWQPPVCFLSLLIWPGTILKCFLCISNPQHKELNSPFTSRKLRHRKVNYIDLKRKKKTKHRLDESIVEHNFELHCCVLEMNILLPQGKFYVISHYILQLTKGRQLSIFFFPEYDRTLY